MKNFTSLLELGYNTFVVVMNKYLSKAQISNEGYWKTITDELWGTCGLILIFFISSPAARQCKLIKRIAFLYTVQVSFHKMRFLSNLCTGIRFLTLFCGVSTPCRFTSSDSHDFVFY